MLYSKKSNLKFSVTKYFRAEKKMITYKTLNDVQQLLKQLESNFFIESKIKRITKFLNYLKLNDLISNLIHAIIYFILHKLNTFSENRTIL